MLKVQNLTTACERASVTCLSPFVKWHIQKREENSSKDVSVQVIPVVCRKESKK